MTNWTSLLLSPFEKPVDKVLMEKSPPLSIILFLPPPPLSAPPSNFIQKRRLSVRERKMSEKTNKNDSSLIGAREELLSLLVNARRR